MTPLDSDVAPPEHTLSYTDDPGEHSQSFVAPYLVIGMECSRPLAPSTRLSIAEVAHVSVGRGACRGHHRFARDGVAVLRIELEDSWMSSDHAYLDADAHGWRIADAGSKNGTFVNGERISERPLADGDLVEIGNSIFLYRSAVTRRFREPPDLELSPATCDPPALATLSIPLARDLAALSRVALSRVPIIVLGETGTGKEVVARAVHQLSARRGAFTAINCGALPQSLIESELFGYQKGAFSGAHEDRPGLIRAADRGTVFLDEIAELAEPSQVKLLRVLQENEVVPLGATRPVAVDIRVIAATHQDLAARVEAGQFRKDLYARLGGFVIALPPLRERREDIGYLVAALLPRIAGPRAPALRFQRAAARALFAHDWRLNIRELEQALSAAVALAGDGAQITTEHLPLLVPPPTAAPGDEGPDHQLRARLSALLDTHRGNISAVAREMGKARNQIRRWCKRLGLEPERFRG
jgi:transcriptional regulator of acetoin/glycerol metabolism